MIHKKGLAAYKAQLLIVLGLSVISVFFVSPLAVRAAFLTDTFTETANTALPSHISDSGHTWILGAGSAATDLRVSGANDRAETINGRGAYYYSSAVPNSADYYIEALYSSASNGYGPGIAVRMATSSRTYYYARMSPTNDWRVIKYINGAATVLGRYVGDTPPQTARLEAKGDRITLFLNGVQRISVIDSSITDAGRPGISSGGSTVSNYLDTLTADVFVTIPDTAAPSVPSNLSATAISSSQVNLSWSASTDDTGVTGYNVYRDGILVATLGRVTSYQQTGLTALTSYTFTVSAFDAAGNTSAVSAAAVATTLPPPDITAPSVPINVSATAISSSEIDLSWSASTDNAGVTGYRIYRNGTFLTAVGAVTSYQNTGLSAGVTHSYTVSAIDAAGNESAQSLSAAATTPIPPDTLAPTSPTGLTATPVSTSQIDLSWPASTDNVGVTGYNVYRDGILFASVGNILSYSDAGLPVSTTHTYAVTAVDASGNESAQSPSAAATTFAAPDTLAPSAPTQLSAVAQSSTQITLSWSAALDDHGVVEYQVYRNNAFIGNSNGALTYTDSGLVASTTYAYAIAAIDAAGNVSAQSASANATTLPVPVSVAFLTDTFTADADGSIVSHTSDSGHTWTLGAGSPADDLRVSGANDRAETIAGRGAHYYSSAVPQSADYYVQATVNVPSNGYGSAIALRMSTTARTFYFATMAPTNQWRIYRMVSGVATILGSYTGDMAPRVVRFEANGSTLTLYLDGIQRISVVDTSITSAGRPGISSGGTAISNFVDDYSAGSLGGQLPPPPPAPDTIAPSTPTNLSASAVSATQVTLSWTASTDNQGVAAYRVYRDGALVGSTLGSLTYLDTGLTASTTYSYAVAAVDASGNMSAQAVSASVLTQGPPPPLPAGSFVFTATGDIGAKPETTVTLQSMAAQNGAFTLALGDLSYNQLVPEAAWCDYVKSIFGQTYPFMIEVGNHENGHEPGGPNGFLANFAQCLPDRLGVTGTYGRQYYFDYPTPNPIARFIMLPAGESAEVDGGPKAYYEDGTLEQQWLNTRIDEARVAGIKWIIVGMHMLCPTGGEKGCTRYSASPGPDLFNFLVNKKVDLVLHGHDHIYLRTKQLALSPSCPNIPVQTDQKPSQNIPAVPANPACVVDSDNTLVKGAGTTIVISGVTPNYQWPYTLTPNDPEAEYFKAIQNSRYGYTKVTVTPTQLTSEFVATGSAFQSAPAFSDIFTISEPGA